MPDDLLLLLLLVAGFGLRRLLGRGDRSGEKIIFPN
jgi:hypothetical protein